MNQQKETTESELHAQALEESLVPVHPGVPGKVPFWNEYARYFMYAPSFDFKQVDGADCYRFRATSSANGKTCAFDAPEPFAPLTPIWLEMPTGETTLTVEAIDKNNKVIAIVGNKEFHKGSVFNGPYHEDGTMDYRKSADRALKRLFENEEFQKWIINEDRYPGRHPAKFLGAIISGMCGFAGLSPRPVQADTALLIAENAAQRLLEISMPLGTPLEFFPPNYFPKPDGSKTDGSNITEGEEHIMLTEPAFVGMSYLDLYDATVKDEYLGAARRIANTYKKLMYPSGSWPLTMGQRTGKETARTKNLCVPINMVVFLERLEKSYRFKEYHTTYQAAEQYLVEKVVKTFNIESACDDIGGMRPYQNNGGFQAHLIARYLFEHCQNNPQYLAMAEELLCFAEDQFVIWEKPFSENPYVHQREYYHGMMTPGVMEQYHCYRPVSSSAAWAIDAWCHAYKATGNPLYLAKARSLANTMMVLQNQCGGIYPTWWNKTTDPIDGWVNCAVVCAQIMSRLAGELEA